LNKSRDDAWNLLTEFVASPSLRRHCLAVETAMRAYAVKYGASADEWGIVGLIHDFDYERHPTPDLHPAAGATILRERGYPEWVIRAILSHADYLDVPRVSRLEQALYAVDELTGFISAVALVRPSRAVAEVTAASVRKKMKDKRFAQGVSREDMVRGAAELGVEFDAHVTFVIEAMAANADALGLVGVATGMASPEST
jgi:putative nucleotidyltransferase with HDIG domain